MVEYHVSVVGMSCRSCENLVRRSVTALPGVARVDADAEVGVVVATGDSGNEERIRQAIEEAGYHPVPSHPDPTDHPLDHT